MNHVSALFIGVRKSSSLCTISVGVLTFLTNRIGDSESYMTWFSHGFPKNSPSVRPWTSVVPYHEFQSAIMRSASAALKRVVFVVTHAVMKPPYDPPVTARRRLDAHG